MLTDTLYVRRHEMQCECTLKNLIQWFASWGTTLISHCSSNRISNSLFYTIFSSFLVSTVLRTRVGREQAAWPFSSPLWSHPEHFPMGAGASCPAPRPPLHCNPAFKQEQVRLVLPHSFFFVVHWQHPLTTYSFPRHWTHMISFNSPKAHSFGYHYDLHFTSEGTDSLIFKFWILEVIHEYIFLLNSKTLEGSWRLSPIWDEFQPNFSLALSTPKVTPCTL